MLASITTCADPLYKTAPVVCGTAGFRDQRYRARLKRKRIRPSFTAALYVARPLKANQASKEVRTNFRSVSAPSSVERPRLEILNPGSRMLERITGACIADFVAFLRTL